MMRIKLEVYIDLDDTPGTMYDKGSARNVVNDVLNERLGHYNPMVSTTSYAANVDPPRGTKYRGFLCREDDF